MSTFWLLVTGLLAGVSAGFFGIGGGIIIVPTLVYLMGFDQHKATGTSLACLLPPVGIAAVLEYSRKDRVDWTAALIIGGMILLGGWLGGRYANQLKGPQLSMAFGIFAVLMGAYTIFTAWQKMRG